MKKERRTPLEIPETKDSLMEGDIKSKQQGFPIIGIGASAGGLEAFEQFFSNMPENSGFAFVVIQHLSPDHKGMLGELIQRITNMQVYTVSNGMKVEPNSIYVIPPNKSMTIRNSTLRLFKPLEKHGLRLPIDLFFRSLAKDQMEQSIGIILSGMGSDGSLGLKAIKERAGRVLVQDPVSAKFDSMPLSAIEAVVVDIVAPADELPEKLINLARQSPSPNNEVEIVKDSSALEKIIILLRSQTGNDFSQYKKTTLYRRIERRMGVHQLSKIGSYVRYLQENPTEISILFKELLIGVTNFFRDPAVWEHLKDNVFPSLFAKLPQRFKIRAWIPGCSSGEEAYSLAIIFKEALEKANQNKNLSLQIFATDLDSIAIDKARKGIYMSNIIADVTPERLNRFFSKVDDEYRINTIIREMVVFAPQNVIKDSPFTKLDMISCRNLLIYMDTDLQKKLLSLFHYSLNPGGILILGSSETHGSLGGMYTSVNSKLRIYQRSDVTIREESFKFHNSTVRNKPDKYESPAQVKNLDNIQTLADQLLLQQFSPASVLVTNKGDILYLTGNIGKYLTLAAGKVNMNLFAMAREGLRNELPMAFREALQSFEKVVLQNIKVENNGVTHLIDVTIQHIQKPQALENKVLVIFTDVPQQRTSRSRKKGPPIDATREAELSLEIQRLKDELESTYEEMQTSEEELKSTNEELQSTNEELQSANEELTTSKEEMQSLNEELQTMNIELQNKIDDSVRINNDMNNLLNSIEIATLFLDKNLNIRQFTSPATKIFKLKQSDIGRLFTDQVTDLEYPEMYNDASEVLRTLVFIEKPVSTRDGRWFSVRVMPYRTLEDKIDGLVITFINITKLKQLEHYLRESQILFNSFIGNLPFGVISMSTDGTIMDFNQQAEKIFGYKSDEIKGKNYYKMFIDKAVREDVVTDIKKLWLGELPGQTENYVKDSNGNDLLIKWSAYKSLNGHDLMIGLMFVNTDKT